MKLFKNKVNRSEYIKAQIEKFTSKIKYCKVSFDCVKKWERVIANDMKQDRFTGDILCLATRSGREIDLFRYVFFKKTILSFLSTLFERKRNGYTSWFPFIEGINKSKLNDINGNSVLGVELNPLGRRCDVHIGSFDELPHEWSERFQIVFSNSLDHALDPHKTLNEWQRVLKKNGYLIVCFPKDFEEPTLSDPVADIKLEDILNLCHGELIYFNKNGNKYSEVIIKK